MTFLLPALGLVFGYLMGSVPYGLVLTRLAGLGDIRDIGSGSIGATNVLRTGRKDLALLTFLGDSFKGTVAILVMMAVAPEGAVLAGLGAFLGHLYPVWLKFKGGKGVATYIGVLLGLHWPAALLFCGIWLVMAVSFRISSLSALTAAVIVPIVIATGLLGPVAGWWVFPILSILVYVAHRSNIQRLMAGTEPKIGAKKPAGDPDATGN